MKRLQYYWFAIRWMWRNRHWSSYSRQKFKAMDRDWHKLQVERLRRMEAAR